MNEKTIGSSLGWLFAAEGFIKAGDACNNGNGIDYFRYYISPKVVNYSLACELLLKLLYAATHNGKYQKTHDIEEIYSKLGRETTDKLKLEYLNQTNQRIRQFEMSEQAKMILSLEDCIKEHRDSFAEWRYLFEVKEHKVSVEPVSLRCLAMSLLVVAKSINNVVGQIASDTATVAADNDTMKRGS